MSAVVPAATGLQQGQLGTDEEREHGAAPRGSAGRHGDTPRRGARLGIWINSLVLETAY